MKKYLASFITLVVFVLFLGGCVKFLSRNKYSGSFDVSTEDESLVQQVATK